MLNDAQRLSNVPNKQTQVPRGVLVCVRRKTLWTLHLVKFNDDTLRPITINELEKRTSVKGTLSHYAVWEMVCTPPAPPPPLSSLPSPLPPRLMLEH